jgi:hypothetical protein
MKESWLFRAVPIFIGAVFLLIVCYFVALGVLAYKAVTVAGEQDWSGGVKPVIEQIWCGKPGCLDK